MKRIHKKMLGLFGLALVTAMTFAAAMLPGPEASAISSITDTIQVRVVGSTPDIKFVEPENGYETIAPGVDIKFYSENVETAKVLLVRKDGEGQEVQHHVGDYFVDYIAGDTEISLNLEDFGGFGDYKITVIGTGYDGVTSEDNISFSYIPTITTAGRDEYDGTYYVDLHYDVNVVCKIKVDLFNQNDMSQVLWTKTFEKPNIPSRVENIPVAEQGNGKYVISVTSYSCETGEPLFRPDLSIVEYSSIPTPDTGGFFQGTNISKEDYLVTGLIIFFILGVVAFGVVAKGRGSKNIKNNKSRKSKR